MTEAEWMACDVPGLMLDFLGNSGPARKLRLFAVACTRRALRGGGTHQDLELVRLAERFADGKAGAKTLHLIRSRRGARGGVSARWALENAVSATIEANPAEAARGAAHSAAQVPYFRTVESHPDGQSLRLLGQAAEDAERVIQAGILRDIIGNPFRLPTVDPAWLSPPVVALARAIYDARSFDRLPELAASLRIVGCADPGLLGHCLDGREHSRGCWAVDALSGRA